jgi:hypothetical protein
MGEDRPSSTGLLILGDLLVLFLVTLTGFATHGEINAFPRMLMTFLPLCLGWGLAAGLLGLYRVEQARDLRSLWRPAAAALLGVPLATWLRGAWLNSVVIPIFVLVMVGMVAIFMTIWRGGWAFLRRRRVVHG